MYDFIDDIFASFSLSDENIFIKNNRIILKITIRTKKCFEKDTKLKLSIIAVYKTHDLIKTEICITSYDFLILEPYIYNFFFDITDYDVLPHTACVVINNGTINTPDGVINCGDVFGYDLVFTNESYGCEYKQILKIYNIISNCVVVAKPPIFEITDGEITNTTKIEAEIKCSENLAFYVMDVDTHDIGIINTLYNQPGDQSICNFNNLEYIDASFDLSNNTIYIEDNKLIMKITINTNKTFCKKSKLSLTILSIIGPTIEPQNRVNITSINTIKTNQNNNGDKLFCFYFDITNYYNLIPSGISAVYNIDERLLTGFRTLGNVIGYDLRLNISNTKCERVCSHINNCFR